VNVHVAAVDALGGYLVRWAFDQDIVVSGVPGQLECQVSGGSWYPPLLVNATTARTVTLQYAAIMAGGNGWRIQTTPANISFGGAVLQVPASGTMGPEM